MHLNHPETTPHPSLWKIVFYKNQFLVPKSLKTTGLNNAPGLFCFYQPSRLMADLSPSKDGNDFNRASVVKKTGLH